MIVMHASSRFSPRMPGFNSNTCSSYLLCTEYRVWSLGSSSKKPEQMDFIELSGLYTA